MKRFAMIALLVSVFAFSGYGQEKPFFFGFKFSPGISWYKSHSKGLDNNGIGFDISTGLIADFRIAGNYFFETGFFYNFQNGNLQYAKKYKDVALPIKVSRDYRVQYLEIPLSIKMCTNYFGMMRFYGLGGFKSSFRINAVADDTRRLLLGEKDVENEDATGDFALFKESLILGLGVDVQIDKSFMLTFGVNGNISLTNVAGAKMKCYYDEESVKARFSNNVIEFRIGVTF
jgi:hypothetical protein